MKKTKKPCLDCANYHPGLIEVEQLASDPHKAAYEVWIKSPQYQDETGMWHVAGCEKYASCKAPGNEGAPEFERRKP